MPGFAKPPGPPSDSKPIPVRFERFVVVNGVLNGGVTITPTTDLGMTAGQLLVIEYVGLELQFPDITTLVLSASIDIGGDKFSFSPGDPIIKGKTNYSTGQNLRLYVDSAEEIYISVDLSDSANISITGSISGYIIDSGSDSLFP